MGGARLARAFTAMIVLATGLGAVATLTNPAFAAPRAGVVTPNGPAATLKFTAGGQTGTVTVQGLAGQELTISTAGGTFANNCGLQLSLLSPTGTTLSGPSCAGQSGAVSSASLPTDGLYLARLVSGAGATGLVTVAATSSAGPQSITRRAEAVTVSITTPDQDLRLGFTAKSGDVVSVVSSAGTLPDCNVSLRFVDSLGVGVGSWVDPCAGATGYAEAAIPTKGTYFVQVLHNATSETGTLDLALVRGIDQAGTITTDGTPVAVAIAKPGQNARFAFSGTTGQRVAAQLTSSTFGPDCAAVAISLVRPDGSPLGAPATTCSSTAFLDTQTLDQTGTWALLVDPQLADTGTASLAAFSSIDQSGVILRNGAPKGLTLTTPGMNARYTFTGNVGQRVSALLTNSTIAPGCPAVVLSFVRPDNTEDNSVGTCDGTAFLDTVLIDQAGTWTILVDPRDGATGTATLQAFNAADQLGLLQTDGSAAAIDITSPGENARWRFSATTGQTVSAQVSSATFPGCPAFLLSLVRPDGTTFGEPLSSCGADALLEGEVLDQDGTWNVVVDPQGTATGTATLQAFASDDTVRPITVNGAPLNLDLAPGHNGRYTFSGTTGQQISARVTSSTFPGCPAYALWLKRPDGTQLGDKVDGCGSSAFLDSHTLDATGSWSIVFDPQGAGSGTAALQAYTFTDETGPADLTGKVVKLVLAKPGENARYSFAGTTGQEVSAYVTQSTITGCPAFALSLERPDGTTLGSDVSSCTASAFLDAQTLDQTGTWTVVVDPYGPGTGNANLQVYNVVDTARTLKPNGPIASSTSTVPGQNNAFSFTGQVGDSRTVTISSSTFPGCPALVVSFVRPDGSVLSTNSTCNGSLILGPSVLDVAGTWTVFIDPQGPAVGTLVIRLT